MRYLLFYFHYVHVATVSSYEQKVYLGGRSFVNLTSTDLKGSIHSSEILIISFLLSANVLILKGEIKY